MKGAFNTHMEITRDIKADFADARGGITRILDRDTFPIRSILLITSRKGTIRSNHYHKTDSHYCYVLSGKAEYCEKPVAGGTFESATLKAGDMVYSAPMTIHAFSFLEDSVMLAFAAQSRSQTDYEADTVRVSIIPSE